MRHMLKIARVVAVAMTVVSLVTVVVAQPPDRPEGSPSRGGSFEGPGAGRGDRGIAGSREGRSGPGSREGRGGPGGAGPGGPPSPERFVEHAMKFDADGDGKLDREELIKFAEEIQRMRGAGGPGGGRGGPSRRIPGGPEGFRGQDGPRGLSEDDYERERPRRPE